MNKIVKFFVAVLAACNYVMQMVMPIFIGLIVFTNIEKDWNAYLLLMVSALATLYQGTKIFVKE